MPSSEPVKFLLVDDVAENLAALEALLRRDGLEILKARSGPEALELLLVHEFALAMLDVQMPDMDGFELAELMRGTERTRNIPIIFLTAVATDERRRFRGYEAGAVDYLLKPIDTRMLTNKADIFFELNRQRKELARQRDELRSTADTLAATLARLQAHGDNSPLAVVEFDAALRFMSWSQGAQRMFGWEAAEIVGSRLDTFGWIHDEDAPAISASIREMFAGGEPRTVHHHRFRHKDGTVLDCECYCSVLLDSAGNPLSINTQILDVTERKRAEETRHLLIGELNHRVKNTLASVQAIANQTLRHVESPADFAPKFSGRIQSLARAHSLLSSTTWKGARLTELIQDQIDLGAIDETKLSVSGPAIDLEPQLALHLALILHELGTNANKYGALSVEEGHVTLDWSIKNEMLTLRWVERGGPPVTPPSRRGFGTTLIERSIKSDGGKARPRYDADGICWEIELPIGEGRYSGSEAFPRAFTPAAPQESAPAGLPPVCLAGKRILVIEDESLVAVELATILQEAGAEIVGPAGNATQAMRMIESDAIDGALLDGNLHGRQVDGIADALVDHDVPFLFVSGYGADHLPSAFGDVPVLGKPFDPRQLVGAVARLLRIREPRSAREAAWHAPAAE
ncbi:MAG TPA: response regulator [Sphingomonadaceae bacterium]|nr:response regulator [Sphingomonadaceae bacterium]